MTDTIRETIREILEMNGCEATSITVEPLFGGHLATVDATTMIDRVPSAAETDSREFARDDVRTQTRHDRQWFATVGFLKDGDAVLRFQGEYGTYGPMVEAEDEVHLQVWYGSGAGDPADVGDSFTLAHQTLVAQSCVFQMNLAAHIMSTLRDDALVAAHAWRTLEPTRNALADARAGAAGGSVEPS
jgi:hypothetical protein